MKSRIFLAGIAGVVLAFAAVAPASACHAIFVAGEGVVDDCTGKHRSPYPDPPPQPTIIYVDISFNPTINVNVSNVVSSTSISSANAGASSSASNTRYIVRPRIRP